MVTKRRFGITKDGMEVHAYTITNGRGISVAVLDYGATLQSVVLPHKGELVDILLGYDSVEDYEKNDGYLGASIGRFAGRIPDAVLRIGDNSYPVTANEGRNQLHGGLNGFDKRVWETVIASDNTVHFCLLSPDRDEGYPGQLMIHATYTLRANTLAVTYLGTGEPNNLGIAWNPTNHAYWNLNGHDAGDTRQHTLEIPADRYVPVGPDMIPSCGETVVTDTRFDFRKPREIMGEYDHSFVLSGSPIRLWGNCGIGMEIFTNCTAVQFYNAKFLDERTGKGGAIYRPFGAVCLETEGRQAMPDMPVAEENIIARSKVSHERITKYRFITKED